MASRRVEAELDALDSLTAPSARIPWEDPRQHPIFRPTPTPTGGVGRRGRTRFEARRPVSL